MKYLMTLLLLISTSAFASGSLPSCYSGSWYDTDRNGEGIDLQVLEHTNLFYFYTFVGKDQMWFTGLGKDTNFTLYYTTKSHENPFITSTDPIGTATIKFVDNDVMLFTFDVPNKPPAGDWCLETSCSGKYVYERLTSLIKCDEPPVAAPK